MFGLGLKPIEVIGGILFILAILGCFFGMGWVSGSNHVQKKFDAYKSSQAVAVEADRSKRQTNADQLDEVGMKQLQDALVENEKLKDQMNDEIRKDAYNCQLPSSGVVQYRKHLRPTAH